MKFNMHHELDEVELYLEDYFKKENKLSEMEIDNESKVIIYEDTDITQSHTWIISLKQNTEDVEMNVVINSVGNYDLKKKSTYDGMMKFFNFLNDHYVQFEATT